jgi:hypothetical protein
MVTAEVVDECGHLSAVDRRHLRSLGRELPEVEVRDIDPQGIRCADVRIGARAQRDPMGVRRGVEISGEITGPKTVGDVLIHLTTETEKYVEKNSEQI